MTTAQTLRKKYPKRVPVILKQHGNTLPALKKHKFLIPKNYTVAEFIAVIRNQLAMAPETALFLFFNSNTLLPMTHTMAQADQEYKAEDSFLYVQYCGENTFG